VATPENEELLLMIALHWTASHVERAVRQFRRAKRNEALEAENDRHERRRAVWHMDEDGCWVMHGRFTLEQGERIMKAVDAAMDEIAEERKDVSAETSRRLACDCGVVPWVESTRKTLRHAIIPDVVRRGRGPDLLNIGRRSRSIPPAIRRALTKRDGGCRFPGCTAQRFVDGHHVVHWADGGETKLDNLVTLCRHHHRAVHEGGFDVRMSADGQPVFYDRKGRRIPEAPETRFRGNVFALLTANRLAGVDVSAETCIPDWHGERMDDDLVVDSLFALSGRRGDWREPWGGTGR